MVSKRVDRILKVASWVSFAAFAAAALAMVASIRVPAVLTIATFAGVFLFPLVRVWLRKGEPKKEKTQENGSIRKLKLSLIGMAGMIALLGSASIVSAACSYYLVPVAICASIPIDFFGYVFYSTYCFIEWVYVAYNCTVNTIQTNLL